MSDEAINLTKTEQLHKSVFMNFLFRAFEASKRNDIDEAKKCISISKHNLMELMKEDNNYKDPDMILFLKLCDEIIGGFNVK